MKSLRLLVAIATLGLTLARRMLAVSSYTVPVGERRILTRLAHAEIGVLKRSGRRGDGLLEWTCERGRHYRPWEYRVAMPHPKAGDSRGEIVQRPRPRI